MMKVVHIVIDCPQALGIFNFWNYIDVDNEFLLEIDANSPQPKVISSDLVHMMMHDEIMKYLASNKYDVVLFHGLHPYRYSLVDCIPQNRVIMWSTWGFDVYYPEGKFPAVVPIKLFQPITKLWKFKLKVMTILYRLYRNIRDRNWNLLKGILGWYQECYSPNTEQRTYQKNILNRIDYISTVLGDFEYKIICQNPSIKADYFLCKYFGAIKTIYSPAIDYNTMIDVPNAKYLLLGNSADPSNNHADVIHILRKKGINMPLYLPMAYANERHYDAFIKKIVNRYNADSIVQEDILPFDEYKKITSSCKIAIFGHLRQQAIGNICMCFARGIKVFLFKNGIQYKYYKSHGYIVFSIEDDLTPQFIDIPLTHEEIEHNIRLHRSTTYDDVVESVNQTMEKVAQIRKERIALCQK